MIYWFVSLWVCTTRPELPRTIELSHNIMSFLVRFAFSDSLPLPLDCPHCLRTFSCCCLLLLRQTTKQDELPFGLYPPLAVAKVMLCRYTNDIVLDMN